MNVLVLTPDAVGSTLLQRLITIFMQLQDFNRPVINLHELTNGLQLYHNGEFNQIMIGRSVERHYDQTLPDLIEILEKADHYKVSRLAHYHILQRQDSPDQQIGFYQYLNKNFFIICTKRKNVLEHALSWCINSFTKKLNVYDPGEKIETFYNLYRDPITIDLNVLEHYLECYKNYLRWANKFFSIGSFFCYEDHLPSIEDYILNLPIFSCRTKRTWNECFGITFSDWNRYHYAGSCIDYLAGHNRLALDNITANHHSDTDLIQSTHGVPLLLEQYENVRDPSWPDVRNFEEFEKLPEHIKRECQNMHHLESISRRRLVTNVIQNMPVSAQNFILANKEQYNNANQAISAMERLNVLPGPLPIKKQTLDGKKSMIKNWQQCVDHYNQWTMINPDIGTPIDHDMLASQTEHENRLWHAYDSSKLLTK